MEPLLRLTDHEREFVDYHASRGKPAVLPVRYPGSVALTVAQPTGIITLEHTRRVRVYKITWSGDVGCARIRIYDSRGQQLTISPTHIPLLSGHTPYSSLSTLVAAYPVPGSVPQAVQTPSRWEYTIDPNLELPGGAQLLFEYTPENPADPVLADPAGIVIEQVVHVWEFPGMDGGA